MFRWLDNSIWFLFCHFIFLSILCIVKLWIFIMHHIYQDMCLKLSARFLRIDFPRHKKFCRLFNFLFQFKMKEILICEFFQRTAILLCKQIQSQHLQSKLLRLPCPLYQFRCFSVAFSSFHTLQFLKKKQNKMKF